jgi:hypothetical protein
VDVVEVEVPLANELVQERADEVAARAPPDLASGHDGELPLEFGVMLPDGAEFGRPFGFQTQLVQLAQKLGLRGVLAITDLAVETDKHELTLAVRPRLDGEVIVVEIGADVAVAVGRVPHCDERARVVERHLDQRDGGLGVLWLVVSGFHREFPKEGSEPAALKESLKFVPLDFRLRNEVEYLLTLLEGCLRHDDNSLSKWRPREPVLGLPAANLATVSNPARAGLKTVAKHIRK